MGFQGLHGLHNLQGPCCDDLQEDHEDRGRRGQKEDRQAVPEDRVVDYRGEVLDDRDDGGDNERDP